MSGMVNPPENSTAPRPITASPTSITYAEVRTHPADRPAPLQ